MPQTRILLFRSHAGKLPILKWLKELKKKNKRAYAKALERIQRLAAAGRELKRPLSAPLRDGIHELRIRSGSEQHRILYFFHSPQYREDDETEIAVLSHGIQKESEVPDSEINRAINHRKQVDGDLEKHTGIWE